MEKFNKVSMVTVFVLILSFVLGFTGPTFALAAGPETVDLGVAGDYVILAKTAITTTGVTSITGDIGISPAFASDTSGFGLVMDSTGCFSTTDPVSLVTGKVYAADYNTGGCTTPAILTTAVSNMEAAYTDAATRTPGTGATNLNVGAGTLSGLNFVPGTYTWNTPGNVTITEDITLTGTATDVWIFQITGTLSIDAGKKIILAGGAQASNVFWQVADAVTLLAGSQFEGIILAQTNIAMQDGAILNGKALTQTAVTLDANSVIIPLVIVSIPPTQDNGTTAGTNDTAGSPIPPTQDNGTTAGTNDTAGSPIPPTQDNGTTAGTNDAGTGNETTGGGGPSGSGRTNIQISNIQVTPVGSSISTTTLATGQTYTISWGASIQNVNTTLNATSVSSGSTISIGTSTNPSGTNAVNWTIPTSATPGDYILHFTDPNNRSTYAPNLYTIVGTSSNPPVVPTTASVASGNSSPITSETSTSQSENPETTDQTQTASVIDAIGESQPENPEIADQTQTASVIDAFRDFLSNKYVLWFFILLLIIAGTLIVRERRNRNQGL